MDQYRNKRVLIVGVGRTGFTLIRFFNQLNCQIKVTDIRPIFDLNKEVKKLKKISPQPEMSFGEHVDEDFLEADVIVYGPSVHPDLPQLELARQSGKEVYSEFALANKFCSRPIIAVCGSYGRTTVAHMIGYCLKMDEKSVFIGGTSTGPFIEFAMLPDRDEIDYVVLEVSALQMRKLENFSPVLVVFTNISEVYPEKQFGSSSEYIETKLKVLKGMGQESTLVVNFDKLANNTFFRNVQCPSYWYSRRSFLKLGVMDEIQGTHFHERRIHSNIHYHSEFKVGSMKIIGADSRENLLASITACKALEVSDRSIQRCIEKFPGIPHRLEFIMEKNGVSFYNDSKCETMKNLVRSLTSFKTPVILIAGGKDSEEVEYAPFSKDIVSNARLIVLVGESKERLNRTLGDQSKTYVVGSFEESILLAYQKSRTGDTILLSPGCPAVGFFRDYDERGNYFKKLVYQL